MRRLLLALPLLAFAPTAKADCTYWLTCEERVESYREWRQNDGLLRLRKEFEEAEHQRMIDEWNREAAEQSERANRAIFGPGRFACNSRRIRSWGLLRNTSRFGPGTTFSSVNNILGGRRNSTTASVTVEARPLPALMTQGTPAQRHESMCRRRAA